MCPLNVPGSFSGFPEHRELQFPWEPEVEGAIACGHPITAAAAQEILQEGGNAFDAVIAAALTACVVEPVLASLAGGGFLLTRVPGEHPEIVDFFVQTPGSKRAPENLDFYPITADFGDSTQCFHIGLGSVATPGVAKGLWEIHRLHASLPMYRLAEPAIRAAREGVEVNAFQSYIFKVVQPIYLATPESRFTYGGERSQRDSSSGDSQRGRDTSAMTTPLVQFGETLRQPDLASTLKAYSRTQPGEGEDLFYRGDLAQTLLAQQAEHGGHLSASDLTGYTVYRRRALKHHHNPVEIYTNPAPASGGLLMALALALLEPFALKPGDAGTAYHLTAISQSLRLSNRARLALADTVPGAELDPALLESYRRHILPLTLSQRGTTHISIIDQHRNVAAMTLSNGEGCGHLIPGSGVMLNNMLGEEDLNPAGFHRWTPGQRMTSMMAPSMIAWPGDRMVTLGSGGSNRIRSAITQVITNLTDLNMPLHQAVGYPRLHVETNQMDIEPGFSAPAVAEVSPQFEGMTTWSEQNLFFGGVHSVEETHGHFSACGDPRRGGVGLVLD